MLSSLPTPHGALRFPIFLPDATRGVVRALDSADLEACGVQAVVMNAFHLMQKPGSTTVKALGGLHSMCAWPQPIVTDSGGFQAYSLIRENPKNGTITDKGLVFRPKNGKDKVLLSPEKSIQLQLGYGADILICLDDCTHAEDDDVVQRASVHRTVSWARRCRATFDQLVTPQRQGDTAAGGRPLLFGVIQGGGNKALRKACAEALLEIGFDGFGYGGWPLDATGNLLEDMVGFTRELVPRHLPMHALGIGHPKSVVTCVRMGYEMFDCAMPTRDARHGRLYAVHTDWSAQDLRNDQSWFSYVYIADDKHLKSQQPISEYCDCLACRRYSRGYLHHLYHIKDAAFLRLATLHNLRFMTQLVQRLAQLRAN
jgi:queuine tRNA-ribosyltransferase